MADLKKMGDTDMMDFYLFNYGNLLSIAVCFIPSNTNISFFLLENVKNGSGS